MFLLFYVIDEKHRHIVERENGVSSIVYRLVLFVNKFPGSVLNLFRVIFCIFISEKWRDSLLEME